MATEAEIREAEARFQLLTVRLLSHPTVRQGTGFGSSPGLRVVGGRIFAMLVRGELVVKLPNARVEELVVSGTGVRFDPGHGRLMKEWVTVAVIHAADWDRLANEAFAFVGGGSGH